MEETEELRGSDGFRWLPRVWYKGGGIKLPLLWRPLSIVVSRPG